MYSSLEFVTHEASLKTFLVFANLREIVLRLSCGVGCLHSTADDNLLTSLCAASPLLETVELSGMFFPSVFFGILLIFFLSFFLPVERDASLVIAPLWWYDVAGTYGSRSIAALLAKLPNLSALALNRVNIWNQGDSHGSLDLENVEACGIKSLELSSMNAWNLLSRLSAGAVEKVEFLTIRVRLPSSGPTQHDVERISQACTNLKEFHYQGALLLLYTLI